MLSGSHYIVTLNDYPNFNGIVILKTPDKLEADKIAELINELMQINGRKEIEAIVDFVRAKTKEVENV